MQNIKENWAQVMDAVSNNVSVVTYELYIKTLKPLEIRDGCLYLEANSETAKKRCEELCTSALNLAISENFEGVSSFKVLNPEELPAEPVAKPVEPTIEVTEKIATQGAIGFNPKYTFDSFVIGKSNQIAYAAARAVAEKPGQKFNPLFIYGGVGLGKTHLLHAIGNYIKQQFPQLKVLYVTAEKFTNDYIDSLRANNKDRSISVFREKYRNLDVLIIDDVQFIENKIETQEEFFHTFNDLHQNNKQIIMASDRHPREIPTLTERLLTRMLSGLNQDIQSPDFETRVAVLKRKAMEENYNIEDDVFDYLAERIDTNIRELEGVLAKVHFYAGIHGRHFASIDDAEEVMKDNQPEKESITPNAIIDTVCKYYAISKNDLTGKKKNKEVLDPRQICIYLITELTDLPLTTIGSYFNGRDHTTIAHSRNKIEEQIKKNNRLKLAVSDLKNILLKN